VQTLLQWRKDKPVIHTGKLTHFMPQDGIYVYFRYDDSDAVMVVLNRNPEAKALELARFRERLEGFEQLQDVVSGETMPLAEQLQVPARSVAVSELR
jgi:hypothetical protein